MAKLNDKFFTDLAGGASWAAGVSFQRSNPLPLDKYSVFESLTKAQEYTSNAVAYPGQLITVAEGGKMVAYVLKETATLNENGEHLTDDKGELRYHLVLDKVGIIPTGDGESISVTEEGVISLQGIDDLEFTVEVEGGGTKTVKYQPLMTKDGLTWVVLSETTVEGLAASIGELDGRVLAAEGDIDAIQAAIGTEATADDGATGIYGKIDAEVVRAKAAEKALGERIDNIDFVDTTELADALSPYATKTHVAEEIAKVQVPVKGVAANDSVITLGADGMLSSTISLSYNSYDKEIKLVGKDGSDLGSIDATPFIKDGMLDDVSYDASSNTLTFTWNTDGETKSDTVVLSDILDPYVAGNGINIDGTTISVKRDTSSESFLTVGADGVKLSGVQDAINTAKSDAATDATNKANAALEEAKSDATTKAGQALADAKSDAALKYATKEYVGTFTTGEDAYKDIDSIVGYVNKKAEETLRAAQGGTSETAASVALALQNYKNENDPKVKANADKLLTIEEGAQVNIIEEIQVNGTKINPSEKKVNIAVPTKFTDITDDSGFDSRITAAQNKADSAHTAAGNAQQTANQALENAATNLTSIGTINGTLSSHGESISDHAGRISALETYDEENTAAIEAIKTDILPTKADKSTVTEISGKVETNITNISGLTTRMNTAEQTLSTKANADDVYTKSEVYTKTYIDTTIGTLPEGKSVVEAIEAAKTAATYDDTAVKKLISDETARATEAEQTNAAAVTTLIDRLTPAAADKTLSIRQIAADEINTLIGGADSADTIDNIKTLVDYVNTHGASVATLTSSVSTNTENIGKNTTAIGDINDKLAGVSTTVADLIDSKISSAALKSSEEVTITNGVLGIGTVSTTKLTGTISTDMIVNGSETLVLNGGTAAG